MVAKKNEKKRLKLTGKSDTKVALREDVYRQQQRLRAIDNSASPAIGRKYPRILDPAKPMG